MGQRPAKRVTVLSTITTLHPPDDRAHGPSKTIHCERVGRIGIVRDIAYRRFDHLPSVLVEGLAYRYIPIKRPTNRPDQDHHPERG